MLATNYSYILTGFLTWQTKCQKMLLEEFIVDILSW
jgi:hypothetical protein